MSILVRKDYEHCAIYHWWEEQGDAPPYSNLRTPILISIATLRAVSDIPIIVLDMSYKWGDQHPYKHDWGHFPEKLNFEVIYNDFEYSCYNERVRGFKHLSRCQDILWWPGRSGIQIKKTMYVDSDVFWLKDPLPFACNPNKFCSDGWNTGFFYFDKISTVTNHFWDIFYTYIKAAIYSPDVRQIMMSYVPYVEWYEVYDEMILTYMTHKHPDLLEIIPPEEHFTLRKITDVEDLSKIKMLHANGLMVSNDLCKVAGERRHSRGLLGLLIREFYENMRKTLNDEDLAMIYQKSELDHYLPQQISLLEDMELIQSTKSKDGLYYLEKCLESPFTII